VPRRRRDKPTPTSRAAPDRPTPAPEPPVWRWLAPLLILAAGVAVYVNGFPGVFLFDDHRQIVDNPRIRDIWPLGPLLARRRPVVDLTLALNYAVHGLNVGGYHLLNLTIHVFAGLLLYGVLRRTMNLPRIRDRYGALGRPLALLPALLWVVHPLQTQSVTYIIQRAESLMGLCFLATLYCVVRGYDSSRKAAWFALAVAACALGMGTKAVMVTAPLVVLLYDYTFLSRSLRELARRRWALYVGFVTTLLIPAATGVIGGVLSPAPRHGATVGFAFDDVTPMQYLATQPGVIVQYLRLSILPYAQCIDYAWRLAKDVSDVAIPALTVLALAAATVVALIRRHWLGFVGAWFLVILAPTSSFIPILDPLVEHRMYLPLAAVLVAAVMGGRWLLRQVFRAASSKQRSGRIVGAVVASACVITLGGLTVRRNLDYHSELAMWTDAVATRPRNPRAHNAHGIALAHLDRHRDAITSYTRALELNPVYTEAQFNLASALFKTGQVDPTIEAYQRTIQLDPTHVRARVNVSQALYMAGRSDEALKVIREALAIDPTNAPAHVNHGNLLFAMAKPDEAIRAFHEAIRLDPAEATARHNLGNTLQQQGRINEAADVLREAVRIIPNDPRLHYKLATILQQLGRTEEAAQALRTASRLGPTPGLE